VGEGDGGEKDDEDDASGHGRAVSESIMHTRVPGMAADHPAASGTAIGGGGSDSAGFEEERVHVESANCLEEDEEEQERRKGKGELVRRRSAR